MGLLKGHRALITGGASGIGRAVAERFMAEGSEVAIVDWNEAAVLETARELGAMALAADVTDPEAVAAAVATAAETLGGISVLVNNAGAGYLAPLQRHTNRDWERMIAVNLTSAFNCMQAVIPVMRKSAQGGCSIINNASASGPRPTRGEVAYSVAKAGLIALTQAAAQELGPDIRVNSVSPGLIRTPMSESLFATKGLLDPATEATPLQRSGTARDVADIIVFLASDLSAYMTGQNLVVDGGMGLAQAGIDDVLKTALAAFKGDAS
ncbi:MAG: SDR family NAD(P)-dependent oxidoreductase [Deltaproteobacteria bacterium]|jgi:NAD(P)-dependent dehydrogenase (short-subunit alcohol dehydrogenase family)